MKTNLRKVLKWTAIALGSMVLLAVLALAAHPLWLGPTAKGIANAVAPKVLGVKFNIAGLDINLYSGRISLTDLRLWNPTNYSDEYAAKLGKFSIDIDMGSLAGDKIVVRDIALDGIYASYVKDDGKYNFDVIAENAVGPADTNAVAKVEPPPPDEEAEAKPQKKVVINHIKISNVKVKYGFLVIPVPMDIELNDLGKETDGVTLSEAWANIMEAVLKSLNSVGQGLDSLGKGAGDVLKDAGGSIKDAGSSIKDAGKDLGRGIKDLFN